MLKLRDKHVDFYEVDFNYRRCPIQDATLKKRLKLAKTGLAEYDDKMTPLTGKKRKQSNASGK